MISPSSRIDIAAAHPDFGGIQYSKDYLQNFEPIQMEFIASARSILLGHNLVYGEHCWQIKALELYLYHPDFWPDETTHFFNSKQRSSNWKEPLGTFIAMPSLRLIIRVST